MCVCVCVCINIILLTRGSNSSLREEGGELVEQISRPAAAAKAK